MSADSPVEMAVVEKAVSAVVASSALSTDQQGNSTATSTFQLNEVECSGKENDQQKQHYPIEVDSIGNKGPTSLTTTAMHSINNDCKYYWDCTVVVDRSRHTLKERQIKLSQTHGVALQFIT